AREIVIGSADEDAPVCARCHDHKFDPIPTRDYYSLYGIFASSIEPTPLPGISPKAITEPYEAHMKRVLDLEKQANNIIKSQVRVLRDLIKDSPDKVPEDVKATLQKIRLNQMPDERQLSGLMP